MNLNNLFEALKPSQYRSLVKGWDKTRYEEIFRQYTTDRKAFRIYIPIVHASGDNAKKVEAPADIKAAVEAAGFVVEDYVSGVAASSDGKRKIKIGKILARSAPELAQKFANDKSRQASKEAEYFCVISRHPYDIAGMSTDRGWTSCMNLETGGNRRYVPADVREGTLVAYLVKNTDKNINSPSARMLIKPFVDIADPKTIAFGIENKIYGTPVDGFKETVEKWCNDQNAKKKLSGLFQLNKNLYNDNYDGRDKAIGDIEQAKEEKNLYNYPNIIKDIENPTERQMMIAVRSDPEVISLIKEPTEKVIGLAIDYSWHVLGSLKPDAKKMVTDEQKKSAIEKSKGSAIMYLGDPSEELQKLAVSVGNVYGRLAKSLKREPSEEVMEAAVRHYPRAIEDMNDPPKKIRLLALEHDGSLIEKIDNPSEEEQMAASKSYKYLLKYMLKKKIKWSGDVVKSALKHFPAQIRYIDGAPAELIKHAIGHDGHALEYILHWTHISPDLKESLIRDALKQNGLAIKWIDKPTKQQQVIAVKTTPEAINIIKNPHPAAVKIANEAGVKVKGWDKVEA